MIEIKLIKIMLFIFKNIQELRKIIKSFVYKNSENNLLFQNNNEIIIIMN